MPRDDLSGLFAPPRAVPSQDARYRQGIVISFDRHTLENQVLVGGTVLVNLPVLGLADASLLVPGAVVGIIPVGGAVKTMYIIGRPVKTTAVPPDITVRATGLCTDSAPVRACLITPDEDPYVGYIPPGNHDTTVMLVWTTPTDTSGGLDNSSYSRANVSAGVLSSVASIYDNGQILDNQPRYGLPVEEPLPGATLIDSDFGYVTRYRGLGMGMAHLVDEQDSAGNWLIGQSSMQFGFDEAENVTALSVERPGMYDASFGTLIDPAAATYTFGPDGLYIRSIDGDLNYGVVVENFGEPNADPTTLVPLKLYGGDGYMHLGGLHVYVFDYDDNQATLTVQDVDFPPDGIPVVKAHQVHGEEQGTETVSFSSATSNTTAVPFGTAFAAAPRVFGNIASTDASADGWTVRCANITTTGFDLYVSGPSASWSSIPVQWHALDGT